MVTFVWIFSVNSVQFSFFTRNRYIPREFSFIVRLQVHTYYVFTMIRVFRNMTPCRLILSTVYSRNLTLLHSSWTKWALKKFAANYAETLVATEKPVRFFKQDKISDHRCCLLSDYRG